MEPVAYNGYLKIGSVRYSSSKVQNLHYKITSRTQ